MSRAIRRSLFCAGLGLASASALAAQGVELPPASGQAVRGALDPAAHSMARLWNEALLSAIRQDTPRPSVHARNLFHVSAAMYDAWAGYSPDIAWLHEESLNSQEAGARRESVAYAAYRLISHRFAGSPAHPSIQAELDALMATLGYDPSVADTSGADPAHLGNRVAQTYIDFGLSDGANEAGNYSDTIGYNPVNIPMLVALPGSGGLADINRWQPLIPPGAPAPQTFLTPHWYQVIPFAIERPGSGEMYLDPGEQPLLGGAGDAQLKAVVIQLIEFGATLDPDGSGEINISPAVNGNNELGTNNGQGHDLNPATGAPYPDNLVLLGDWGRVLAEFWADGPKSSTPPGHWNEIANTVSDAIDSKRLQGEGPPVPDLEWDIKLYFALNGAVHDAAVAGWEVKYLYESARPITLIRGMAELGQSSDDTLPSWHPDGLPLVPDLVEVITTESAAAGERHAHLADFIGEIAVRGWRGHPADPETSHGGVGWIRAVEWLPYQARTFVTPPFGGYVSGHSTFSRASAEVLAGFTGSEYFPGGLGEFTVAVGGDFELEFEYGPSEPVRLQWATYFDAADEAGLSRIYGGIHPTFDDLPGRVIGHEVGQRALDQAFALFAEPRGMPSPAIAVPSRTRWGMMLLILGAALLGWRRLA